jgi:hypothetical protein
MAASEVSVWLFNVSTCGYYDPARANRGAPAQFGGIAELLASLDEWAAGKRLSETSTYDVVADSETSQTYFLCLRQAANGDMLLGLWNKIQTNSNKIASVGVNDIVGQVVTEVTEIDEDRIPGHATYFYILPAEGKIATVRVQHPINGLYNFKRYLKSFLTNINPKHVILGEPDEDGATTVVGYRENPASHDVKRLRPRLRIDSIPRLGEKEFLIQNSGRIRKAISKTTITGEIPDEREWWQRGLQYFGLRPGLAPVDLLDEVVIKAEIPMTFEQDEVRQIIDEWEARQNAGNELEDDIGFVMQGESATHWLSRSYARKVLELELQWIDEEQVNPDFLLEQLVRHRNTILSLVR